MLIADDEQRQYVVEYVWGHLLLCIAPGLVGVAMALDNQSVETKVHCLLTEWRNEIAASADMTWVAYYWQVGYSPVQLYWNLPHRQVAVNLLVDT